MHISKMTGKLKDIPAINTNTVTNIFCNIMRTTDAICRECYSLNMLTGSRKNCQPAFQRNSELFSEPIPYEDIPTINAAFFRFHGHGELINMAHMKNFHDIARKNPHCNFALWTKRRDIIRQYHLENIQPKNLILIYSNPKVGAIRQPPQGFDKCFNVVGKDEFVENQNCTGQKCIDCLKCYKQGGDSIIVEAIKKRS
jgi:hypothetical protein